MGRERGRDMVVLWWYNTIVVTGITMIYALLGELFWRPMICGEDFGGAIEVERGSRLSWSGATNDITLFSTSFYAKLTNTP
jgi:hypothetical protein